MGEAKKIMNLGNENKPLRKRACKICGEDCEIWGTFKLNGHETLFDDISEHVDSNILIDSTKDLNWINSSGNYAHNTGFELLLIFLKRDGRAVVNSRIRKYPERDPEKVISNWIEKIQSTNSYFEEFEGLKYEINYEELTRCPEKSLKELCDSMNLKFSENALDLTKHEHHPFGGNNGTQYLLSNGNIKLSNRVKSYYQNHSGGIEPDERWKDELSEIHLNMYNDMTRTLLEN